MMTHIFAKIREKGKVNKYRMILSVEEEIYQQVNVLVPSTYLYSPESVLQPDEWYRLEGFSETPYAIDLIKNSFSSVDFPLLQKKEYDKVDFLFVDIRGSIFFQRIGRAKAIKKKGVLWFGEGYQYSNDVGLFVLNECPDAIYVREEDVLYFRNLERINGIFKRITDLYREATEQEVEQFLQNEFLAIEEGFSVANVGITNRKRIALATDKLSKIDGSKKIKSLSYIREYCPELVTDDQRLRITSEDDLKKVLYGIDERFYTTEIGEEKRLANSVIPLNR